MSLVTGLMQLFIRFNQVGRLIATMLFVLLLAAAPKNG